MSRSTEKLFVALVLLGIAIGIWAGVYSCIRNDCTSRGGHLEPIYGGKNTQYVCMGATE